MMEPQKSPSGLDLTRRILAISENMENNLRINRNELEELKNLAKTLSRQVEQLHVMLDKQQALQIKYLLIGASIGLAGRQVLADIYSLLK